MGTSTQKGDLYEASPSLDGTPETVSLGLLYSRQLISNIGCSNGLNNGSSDLLTTDGHPLYSLHISVTFNPLQGCSCILLVRSLSILFLNQHIISVDVRRA